MPQWSNSTRRDRLPADWPKRRKRRLRFDKYRCQQRLPNGTKCEAYATDVDHVIPNDNHDQDNLQSLCGDCHATKSSSEGGRASAQKRRQANQKFRRTEEHPGLL